MQRLENVLVFELQQMIELIVIYQFGKLNVTYWKWLK
jgi:hypothetical protein